MNDATKLLNAIEAWKRAFAMKIETRDAANRAYRETLGGEARMIAATDQETWAAARTRQVRAIELHEALSAKADAAWDAASKASNDVYTELAALGFGFKE